MPVHEFGSQPGCLRSSQPEFASADRVQPAEVDAAVPSGGPPEVPSNCWRHSMRAARTFGSRRLRPSGSPLPGCGRWLGTRMPFERRHCKSCWAAQVESLQEGLGEVLAEAQGGSSLPEPAPLMYWTTRRKSLTYTLPRGPVVMNVGLCNRPSPKLSM